MSIENGPQVEQYRFMTAVEIKASHIDSIKGDYYSFNSSCRALCHDTYTLTLDRSSRILTPSNLDGDVSKSTTVQVSTGGLDNVVVVDVGNGERVGLGTPRAVPVDVADPGVPHIEVKVTLCSRGGIRPATRSDAC